MRSKSGNDHAAQATVRHYENIVKELQEAGYRVELVDRERYYEILNDRAEQLRQSGLLK